MSTQEVADKLVNLCRQGKFDEAYDSLYADNIVSLEQEGGNWPARLEGMEAVRGKSDQWSQMVEEFHGVEVSDPIVAEDHFCCKMKMDTTMKEIGRNTMEELCMYQVNDGKIVKEQFFYAG